MFTTRSSGRVIKRMDVGSSMVELRVHGLPVVAPGAERACTERRLCIGVESEERKWHSKDDESD